MLESSNDHLHAPDHERADFYEGDDNPRLKVLNLDLTQVI
jgi:hypothetical protein